MATRIENGVVYQNGIPVDIAVQGSGGPVRLNIVTTKTDGVNGRVTFSNSAPPLSPLMFGSRGSQSAIQSALNAANIEGGGTVVIPSPAVSGEKWLITSPLIIYSNTHLILEQGVLFQLPAGYQANLIQNAAYKVTSRGWTDGVMTAASAVLQSSTAEFTSADVGKRVTVQGAGVSASDLVTTILSITDPTHATLSAAASTNTQVAGAYWSIGDRDHDIKITGGYWHRIATYGADNNDRHIIVIHRCDGVNISSLTAKNVNGKYAVFMGDVTRVVGQDVHFDDTASDGFHINGPAKSIRIDNLTGHADDDFMPLLTHDYATYASTCGRYSDVEITSLHGSSATVLLKLQANADYCAGLAGSENVRASGVIAGDSSFPNAVRISSGISSNGKHGDINISGVFGKVVVNDGVNDGGSVRSLRVSGIRVPVLADNAKAILIGRSSIVETLLVEDAYARITGQQNALVGLDNTAQVKNLTIRNADWGSGTGTVVVQFGNASNVITTARMENIKLENTSNTGGLLTTVAGCTLTRLFIRDIECVASANLASFNCNTALFFSNLRSNATGINVNSGYTVTARGSGFDVGSSNTSAGTLICWSADIRVDVSSAGISRNANNICYNTNASLACGAGTVISNGTSWKHIYTGLTY